jgi:tetratricopeptide (TPR) repeat protein
MTDHPSRDALSGFLLGRLAPGETKDVVAHLVRGCERCNEEMSPVIQPMFRPGRDHGPLAPEAESAYDDAVSRACRRAAEWRRRIEEEREQAGSQIGQLLFFGRKQDGDHREEPGFWTWGLCEVLLEKSWSFRYDDPQTMLHLAELARETSDRLDSEIYGSEAVADLQARAWGELANSYRVADDLLRSEAALVQALAIRKRGSGEPLLRARLAELAATLCCHQRRFPDAFRALDLAQGLYLRHGDPHDAGRMVLQKGIYTGRSGDPEQGIRLLARSLKLIDRDRDPKLVFQILHNILLFRVELGEFRDANLQLFEMRPLYALHAGELDRVKLRWIEGRIAVGLAELDRAERAFLYVKEEFESRRLLYPGAIVSLDLASIWLQQGKTAEVRRLVAEMVEVFRARYVAREAIAALLMLREAVERDQVSLDLVRAVVGIIERHQDEPTHADAAPAI